eukprot:6569536-Prymnesium_polylepis.1
MGALGLCSHPRAYLRCVPRRMTHTAAPSSHRQPAGGSPSLVVPSLAVSSLVVPSLIPRGGATCTALWAAHRLPRPSCPPRVDLVTGALAALVAAATAGT